MSSLYNDREVFCRNPVSGPMSFFRACQGADQGLAIMKTSKPPVYALGPSPVAALAGPTIYVVDDAEGLAELYTLFLKGTGCSVRAYNHRADALAALAKDRTRPDLLIMDYLGDSMPVDRFLECCLAVHPSLRILMASELRPGDVMSLCVRPDRSIQKPFTADEFVQEVRAILSNE